MDKEQSIEIAKRYTELVRSVLPVQSIILFGSYARGDNREYSDIDIAVVVKKVEGDYLELSARLCELGWQIDSRIEPVLVEATRGRSGFLESILQYGIQTYRAA